MSVSVSTNLSTDGTKTEAEGICRYYIQREHRQNEAAEGICRFYIQREYRRNEEG